MSSIQPVRADLIEPQDVEWIWGTSEDPNLIPRGMFSMIAGKPDQGKSMIATKIAADVTKRGGNVLYSSKERAAGLVEKPRFIAAGGVPTRMHYWRFSLPAQFDELAAHIIDKSIDLVVMDPVSAHFIGVSTSSDKIREHLNALTALIEATGTAILFVEHALKRVSPNADPLSAVRGNSSGIPAACAIAYLFGDDPEPKGDDEGKILASVKSNIRLRPKAVSFAKDSVPVEGWRDEQPVLIFDQLLDAFDPIRLIARKEGDVRIGRPNDKLRAAVDWLTRFLASHDEPVKGGVVQEEAARQNLTPRTLRRAASEIGVVKDPPGGGPSVTWELPGVSEADVDAFLASLGGGDMP